MSSQYLYNIEQRVGSLRQPLGDDFVWVTIGAFTEKKKTKNKNKNKTKKTCQTLKENMYKTEDID